MKRFLAGFFYKVALLHDSRDIAIMFLPSHGVPSVIVAGKLGHSISILLTTCAHFIPTMQDEAAQLLDDILTPIPIEIRPVSI